MGVRMRNMFQVKRLLGVSVLLAFASWQSHTVSAQEAAEPSRAQASPAQSGPDLATLQMLVRELQGEVRDLRVEVRDLRTQQESARADSADLRNELGRSKAQGLGPQRLGNGVQVVSASAASNQSTEERIARLEEDQQLADAKIAEQSQTKVESGSKYRVRLSGMVLLNMYGERGYTDNSDFPQQALPADPLASAGSFGGSLRQTQIGIQAFGPTIGGARTSADLQFDFAGGFPGTQNGVTFGTMRLRTGTMRFDWKDTSVVGGQDSLFFAPLNPTSIATLAAPALAYSGNLWSWTPQIRIEHRFLLSDTSSLLLQGGILDNLTGDVPASSPYRFPSWGEFSGQPAYAARLAWTRRLGGQDLTIGTGGYYGRQLWGFGRAVDGWAGMMDLKLPLGRMFEFTGQFYRGRAVGGIGGGLGQSVAWNAPFTDPGTAVHGLNSAGGWAQLKYRATPKLQFNAAVGQDNPFASDLRNFGGNGTYIGQLLSKNQSGLVNFIYQPRSDLVLSWEYKKIKTFILDSNPNSANRGNFSVGYIF